MLKIGIICFVIFGFASTGWAQDEKAKVSSGDTTEGFLMDKLQAGPDIELTESGTSNRVIIIGRKPVLTTKGDVLTHDGNKEIRLGVGANGEVLTSDSTAPNGIKWDSVPAGPQGPEGPAGPQGPQGIVGPQGLQGDTGPQGPIGLTGSQGATGATGAQGPIGATGPQGIQGVTGATGATGPAGDAGPVGPAGASGKDEADGVEILFTREFQYDPGTGSVPAIDLNGTDLVISQTDPTVTLAGQTINVLNTADIPNTTPPLQQVIVDMPETLIAGNYKLKLSNTQGDSEAFIPLSELSVAPHDGVDWEEITTSLAKWSERNQFESVVFDNKMWVLQGYVGTGSSSSYSDEIWYTSDGVDWNKVTGSSPLPDERQSHGAVVFNNKMYVMGGSNSTGNLNDVWRSDDGITWEEIQPNADWAVRTHFDVVVYDGKMWIMGGYGNTGGLNDIWYSTDGIDWDQAANAPWSGRYGHTVLTLNNKVYVINGLTTDVWSFDGTSWNEETSDTLFANGKRYFPAGIVYDSKMWIIAGQDGNNGVFDEVYNSTDGEIWNLVTDSPPWSARSHLQAEVFQNRIWIMGGFLGAPGYLNTNEVWATLE